MKEYKYAEKCPKCGGTNFWYIDNDDCYCQCCNGHKCAVTTLEVDKKEVANDFECPECGGLAGTLEENHTKLGIRCNNCKKLTIILEKREGIDNRGKMISNISFAPRCPKCGSTAITASQKGFSMVTGFWGSNKTVNRCANCGHTWKPGR